jgi:hypothetical protein
LENITNQIVTKNIAVEKKVFDLGKDLQEPANGGDFIKDLEDDFSAFKRFYN